MIMSVNIRSRLNQNNTETLRLDGINFADQVKDLRHKVAQLVNSSEQVIELIYCGQRLKDERPTQFYGIQNGSTIYALQRHIDETDAQSEPPVSASEVVSAVRLAVVNPAYRSIVKKMVTNWDSMENILATTPGLDKDPVCISLLQDPELLASLVTREHINKLLSKHPAFGNAALAVATAVNKNRPAQNVSASRGAAYSLDRMSDDDEETGASRGASGGNSQTITASQLAAALATATGRPLAATSNPGSSQADSGPPVISSDFFQQAMMQAQSSATESQLQQLRDMGIQDESRAREALQATGGDIQAALELLFEEDG